MIGFARRCSCFISSPLSHTLLDYGCGNDLVLLLVPLIPATALSYSHVLVLPSFVVKSLTTRPCVRMLAIGRASLSLPTTGFSRTHNGIVASIFVIEMSVVRFSLRWLVKGMNLIVARSRLVECLVS